MPKRIVVGKHRPSALLALDGRRSISDRRTVGQSIEDMMRLKEDMTALGVEYEKITQEIKAFEETLSKMDKNSEEYDKVRKNLESSIIERDRAHVKIDEVAKRMATFAGVYNQSHQVQAKQLAIKETADDKPQ